jgi:16S rRNA (cytidine1402-2'-O)-methyltransferase
VPCDNRQVSGLLSIVSTPIGNLDDLSPRALDRLRECDLVVCEDTRRSGLLLKRLGLKKPLLSLHQHNERRRLPRLLDELSEGRHLALVTDAGTPLISDPGYLLVREALQSGAQVEAVPGPSAVLAALVVSGLPPYPFTFAGFPPTRPGRRRNFLRGLANLPHTLVLYVSPHRLLAVLEEALAELGDRPAALARELTKLHEEVVRGSLTEIRSDMARRDRVRGEVVLVVAGAGTEGKGG